jgi:hypothetical protein
MFGPRGPEPVSRVDDPVFGPLAWFEDEEAWFGRYGGYRIANGTPHWHGGRPLDSGDA